MGSNGGMRYGGSSGGGAATATARAAGVSGAVTAAGVAGMDRLTREERKAVDLYTESSSRVNGVLRGRFTETSREPPTAEDRSRIGLLDAAMAKGTLARDATLYRGTSLPAFGLTDAPKVGQVISDKAFQSTSTNQAESESFGGRGPMNLTIAAGRGTRAIDASYVAGGGEGEILLDRGTRYQVTSVRTTHESGGWSGPPVPTYHVGVKVVR